MEAERSVQQNRANLARKQRHHYDIQGIECGINCDCSRKQSTKLMLIQRPKPARQTLFRVICQPVPSEKAHKGI